MLQKLLYPELSYKLVGLCFQVHNELGHFAREKQYSKRLEQLLALENIQYQREVEINFQATNGEVGGNIADFLIEEKIILECKAKICLIRKDYYQVQRYLRATNKELGLLVNFNEKHLKPKRVLNYLHYNS
jgi:GxxExxY protein